MDDIDENYVVSTVIEWTSFKVENLTLSSVTESYDASSNFTNLNISTKRPVLSKYRMVLVAELSLSIVCSVLLICVYVIIGEHRTLPGKTAIHISLCFIVAYIFLMIDFIMRGLIPYSICFAMGVIAHTFFLASFFWTNVMSYDIMRTMMSVKPGHDRTLQFWKYFIYAWTTTLLCVVPAVIIDHIELIPLDYKPKFGKRKCWLNGGTAFFVYFNAPVGITLLANCVFFVFTARTITKVQSATGILAANRHKERYRLCMKLVLIMGLEWIPEFLPWLTETYWLLTVAEILFCLHGVYMFVIFACKRRTLKQVAVKVCPCFIHNLLERQSPSLMTVISTNTSSIQSGSLRDN